MKNIIAVLLIGLAIMGCQRQNDNNNNPQNPVMNPYLQPYPGSAYPGGCQQYYGQGWGPSYNYNQNYYPQNGMNGMNSYYQNPQNCLNFNGVNNQYGYNAYQFRYNGGTGYGTCFPGGPNTCLQGVCRPIDGTMGVCSQY